jgi:fluoride exporter
MSITALHVIAVALGGAVGGMMRFAVSGIVARRLGERFPWGTLVVNATGATLIGGLAALMLAHDTHIIDRPSVWALLVVGVLGSYTTVSSFSYQTLALVRSGEPGRAGVNVAASVTLCLGGAAAAYLGVIGLLGMLRW